MKYFPLILVILVLNCKNDSKIKSSKIINEENSVTSEILIDSMNINLSKVQSIELKQKMLIEKKDKRNELQELIIEKKYFKKTKTYTIDFTYPLLNKKFKPTHINFNEYINDYYLDIIGT